MYQVDEKKFDRVMTSYGTLREFMQDEKSPHVLLTAHPLIVELLSALESLRDNHRV